MKEELKQLEEERKKIHKQELAVYIFAAVINLIAILILIFFDFFYLLLGTIIVSITMIANVSAKAKKFNSSLKDKIVVGMIHQELGADAVYQPNGGIPLEQITKLGMYKTPDRCHEEDYISAVYNQIPYQMCDARFEERHEHYDSKGTPHVSYTTYFSGRIIRIDFKRHIDTFLMVVEGNPNGLRTAGLEKVETEVIDFNKKYKTYVSSKEKAFYFLTPVLIQKMLELEKLFKGSIQYCMDGDCFYVFINNSVDSLDAPLSKKLDEKTLSILRSQITIGEAIINEFGLDEMKFNEEVKI